MLPEKVRYQDIIRREFETRCARNGHYSLRAFARDLGLPPASLSLVLNGKQGLSVPRARHIATRLGLNPGEREYFCDLVGSLHSRNPSHRKLARIRLHKHESKDNGLTLDVFQVLSDWYHLAILELTVVESFESSVVWIARTLGIPDQTAQAAIERLKRLDLLEEAGGKLRQTAGFLATPSGIPSEAIKRFHQQVLTKAERALITQPVETRDFSAVVVPVRREDIELAKERIKAFRRELAGQLEAAPTKEEVYCLSIQFFSLQEAPVVQGLRKEN